MKQLILFILLLPILLQAQTRVTMTEENGIYTIPCTVNGLNLRFVFDTGASNVCISLTEAVFMIKNGYLKETDIIGSSYAQIANGEIIANTQINIKEMDVAGVKLYNVKASVIHESKAPLLFGQTAIQQLGTIQLDGSDLIIQKGTPSVSTNESTLNTLGLFKKGFDAHVNGLYYTAVDYFKEYLILNPRDAGAYGFLGIEYNELKNYYESIRCYRKAIELRPDYAVLLFGVLGVVYYNIKDYEESIRCYQKAIELNPTNHEAYYTMGNSYVAINDYNNAIKSFRKAIEIKPDYSDAYTNMSVVYIKLGNFNESIRCCQKAVNINPNNSEAYSNMAISYASLDNKYDFVRCAQTAARLGNVIAQNMLRENGYGW